MITAFPSPVLSIAADVVKDLDGGDALSGLWTLFTKCKESLQDGRRLENISWRLWYREVARYHASRASTPDILVHYNEKPPLSPISQDGREPHDVPRNLAVPLSHHETSPSFPNGRTDASSATDKLSVSSFASVHPMNIRTKPGSSVGKIIADMIPDKLVVSSSFAKHPFDDIKPIPTSFDAYSVSKASADACIVVAPIPTMRLPPPNPPSGTLFPRVVVVNPTPHPTPPATPVPVLPSSTLSTLSPKQTHLAIPSRTGPPTVRTSASANGSALPANLGMSSRDNISPPKLIDDDALKPSDRRFFLQQEESPSPERDSIDRGSVGTDKTPSDANEVEPSSLISNQTKASTSSNKRQTRGRKTKEPARATTGRTAIHRFQGQRHTASQRKTATSGESKPRSTPTVSSGPINGTKVPPGPPRQAPLTDSNPKSRVSSPQKVVAPVDPQRRGIIVTNSSSEYETDSDDDDSWASEDVSNEESEKKKEEIRLREAALEAQRQRELFAKVPKRSYSNLNRTQSGLLSVLLNPDPSRLPPGHPYRSNSSADVGRPRTSVPPPLSTSKSTAAVPLAAQITAQAPALNGGTDARGYRPKGRPQGQEMEEDSDSDEENPDDTIQLSRSIAQQKLAALTGRRNSDRGIAPSAQQVRPVLHTVATAPIPLDHPWNLPPAAAPSTPRTTRRQMLATELSESLRRNLLWERQLGRPALGGARRGGVLGSGLRPLTAATTTATTTTNGTGQTSQQQQYQQQDKDPGGRQGGRDDDREERKRRAMARNRSWADDYHYSGW